MFLIVFFQHTATTSMCQDKQWDSGQFIRIEYLYLYLYVRIH